MKMTGIIFSEMYSDALNSFTQDRTKDAMPDWRGGHPGGWVGVKKE